MGYLRAPETDQLALPSDPSYFVHMKRRAAYGDALAAQSAMLQVSTGQNGQLGQMVTDVEFGAYIRELTVRLITEWNLTDEADQPLPVSRETLDLLAPEDGQFLAEESQKRLGQRPAEQADPFSKPSGPSSTASKSRTAKHN